MRDLNKIIIPLSNNYRLVAEQNTGEFNKEIIIGIETPSGVYMQDLALIRPTYKCKNDDVIFDSDKYEILVYGDSEIEDYTNKFTVSLHQEDDK